MSSTQRFGPRLKPSHVTQVTSEMTHLVQKSRELLQLLVAIATHVVGPWTQEHYFHNFPHWSTFGAPILIP